MRGLTPIERDILADALLATRRGGGLHIDSRGDLIVAGRLERRGALLCSPCFGDNHYTVTSIGLSIIDLDAMAEAPLPPGCF